MKYLALLRGINVGGKNKIPMADLKTGLEEIGFKDVRTYIASGNVILNSELTAKDVSKKIEALLPKKFKLDSTLIKVLVLSQEQLGAAVKNAPEGFGTEPDKYHCDVIFLFYLSPEETIKEFDTHPEVDAIWAGPGVVYFRRLSAKRTKSRLGKIIGKPVYKNMTIRSWNTTTKLLELLNS